MARSRPSREQVEQAMTDQLAKAIYPVLFPIEQQDCQIQARHLAIVYDIARNAWRAFRAAGGSLND